MWQYSCFIFNYQNFLVSQLVGCVFRTKLMRWTVIHTHTSMYGMYGMYGLMAIHTVQMELWCHPLSLSLSDKNLCHWRNTVMLWISPIFHVSITCVCCQVKHWYWQYLFVPVTVSDLWVSGEGLPFFDSSFIVLLLAHCSSFNLLLHHHGEYVSIRTPCTEMCKSFWAAELEKGSVCLGTLWSIWSSRICERDSVMKFNSVQFTPAVY